MKIISHRGIGFGKEENTLGAYQSALKNGFGIEIDVHKTRDDVLVVSHDYPSLESFKCLGLGDVLDCFKKYGKDGEFIAIHIKDEMQNDIINSVLENIKSQRLENTCLLFDLTKCGAKHIGTLCPRIKTGYSVGEKRYGGTIYTWDDVKDDINMDFVWWDEWKSGLYTQENAKKIKKRNITNFTISPELHKDYKHPASEDIGKIKDVWKDLIEWGVDGICTDYPRELKRFLEENPIKV